MKNGDNKNHSDYTGYAATNSADAEFKGFNLDNESNEKSDNNSSTDSYSGSGSDNDFSDPMGSTDYSKQTNSFYTNQTATGANSGVQCDAEKCVYNRNGCQCTASTIKVGTQGACSSWETECDTFKPKSEG